MMKDGSDYKEELLQEPKLIMIVTYDLSNSSMEWKNGKLHQDAKNKGIKLLE
jgi:hypothetical protein